MDKGDSMRLREERGCTDMIPAGMRGRWKMAAARCFLQRMPNPLEALSSRLDPARVRASEPIAPYTTFKIGGPADIMFEARTADEVATAILAARDLSIPYFVLGLGANILVGDKGF